MSRYYFDRRSQRLAGSSPQGFTHAPVAWSVHAIQEGEDLLMADCISLGHARSQLKREVARHQSRGWELLTASIDMARLHRGGAHIRLEIRPGERT